ncbi:carboxyl transferase domain-containing protein [Mesorhizobium sp. ANAO-SY3R2]|uniref:acetyl-CoA carboxylase family protein n=1 Tax=Mesorhizobium sp. ANAO-SY3R2 TaxID=3166644 RepID=UPI00366FCF3D
MAIARLLIANRGEIAIRIARAAAELGIETVSVFTKDDERSLHVKSADQARLLPVRGAAGYLDIEKMVALAQAANCDAVHPGYGFLSENAAFARALEDAGIRFVGPRAELLDLFGDKARARAFAEACDVPVAAGTAAGTTIEEARSFFAALPKGDSVLVKAAAGGGGRGMRLVSDPAKLEDAMARCRSEAAAAFGDDAIYVERFMPRVRHIEIQIIGDGTGSVVDLGERECSLQRRYQKLVEYAPSPSLSSELRARVVTAARQMAAKAKFNGLGTFEFLVSADGRTEFIFIECNPRLQVEHTVTEEVTGVDLVKAQLRLAAGEDLAAIGLDPAAPPKTSGFAVQLRVNMETLLEDGNVTPSVGRLDAFDLPGGPGVRVDTFGYAGYENGVGFDSLLAKVIIHALEFPIALNRAQRALAEFRIAGLDTNIGLLRGILGNASVQANEVHTRFVEDNFVELRPSQDTKVFGFSMEPGNADQPAHRKIPSGPPNTVALVAPMPGLVVAIGTEDGATVSQSTEAIVIEAMKSELVVRPPTTGVVRQIVAKVGDLVRSGDPMAFIEPSAESDAANVEEDAHDLDEIRPDLAEVLDRKADILDAGRPDAVAKRHASGSRMARENIDDLCDTGSFIEYGSLIIAMQRGRRPLDELKRVSPADGMIAGFGNVNGNLFGVDRSRCAVLAYDYTVFAGTQGFQAHEKKDRLFSLVERLETPLVMFTEGGGGRPGDTDFIGAAGLNLPTFWHFGRLSAKVPIVGISSGRCFAGNAALLGGCDVIIATRNSSIGMAGPAMIEAAGLGTCTPEDIGPVSVQAPNGVIDIVVEDEAEAVQVAKQYLSYFQGTVAEWSCPDQRLLRRLVPENRLRGYDIREVLATIADTGSLLEIRRAFAPGMITAFMRIEGRPIGVIANNPLHLGGAIDAPGADKAARFMQLCDAFDIPLLSLCDTPGFMVGPESEQTATVRHFSRLFVIGANLSVPMMLIVLRKAYGLGAQAMAGGTYGFPMLSVSWPTGEMGPMGLEGAVQLAYRKELSAIAEPELRQKRYQEYVAEMYRQGKAMNAASFMEIDDVIDPADTRRWLSHGLRTAPKRMETASKKRPYIDTW